MVEESRPERRGLEPWLRGVIFLGLFFYVWQGVGPHLLYYGFGVFTAYPIFSLEGSFLRSTLSTPGGILGALAALLAQSYRIGWLGAATITVALGVLFLGIQHLLRSMRAGKFRDLAWVPVLLALTIYNHYYENPLPAILAVGLSIWAAILYGALAVRTLPGRAGLFLALFAGLYYMAGAVALVFAAIACLTEALLDRKITLAIVQAVLAAGGAFVIGSFVFGLEPRAVYTTGTPWDPSHAVRFSPLSSWLAFVLHVFAPSLILVVLLGQVLIRAEAGRRRRRDGREGNPQVAAKPRRTGRWRADSRVWIGVRMLLVAVTMALCVVFSWTHVRCERMLHYYAQHREWDEVLALAGRMHGRQPFTRSGVFDINRALAHRGRLGSELCAFPQSDTKTLFLDFDDMAGRLRHAKLLELYLDLGCLNAAEKNGYELLDHEGSSPPVLESLIRIHLAKGQYESAQVVFRALQKCVGCRAQIRRWRDVVADPTLAQTDALVRAWRQAGFRRDYASTGISVVMLKRLLQDVPHHRLAFEYLMACYLLKHQRVELVKHLPLLRPLGYRQLPRHVAEALLVHSLETRTPVNAQGWAIDADLQRQFREIRGVVARAQGDHQAAFNTLVPKYGDSYVFYSMFNVCGGK